jgi:hypothetical protein
MVSIGQILFIKLKNEKKLMAVLVTGNCARIIVVDTWVMRTTIAVLAV